LGFEDGEVLFVPPPFDVLAEPWSVVVDPGAWAVVEDPAEVAAFVSFPPPELPPQPARMTSAAIAASASGRAGGRRGGVNRVPARIGRTR
jgi:hypothetical protein